MGTGGAAAVVIADDLARIVDVLRKRGETGTRVKRLIESDIAAAAVEESVAAGLGLWTSGDW
jgi:hypothetical protein